MKDHLRRKRDKIIRDLWIDNITITEFPLNKSDFFEEIKEIFSNPPAVPSFYRIIKEVDKKL